MPSDAAREPLSILAREGLLGLLLALAILAIVYLVVRDDRRQRAHAEELARLHDKHEAALQVHADARAAWAEKVTVQVNALVELAKVIGDRERSSRR